MRYLLDTNIFLWWLNDDNRLKKSFREAIGDSSNQIITSVASAWEISIKSKTGKLPLKTTFIECVEKSEFEVLNIDIDHVRKLDKLPPIHKDPFDRILIAQAKAENLTLITTDEKIKKYDVKTLS